MFNRKEYMGEYYQEHKEEFREYQIKCREKIKQYIDNFKLSKGCSVCGYNKCARALEFHHNGDGDKNFWIVDAIRNKYSLEKIKIEIDKCTILCSNCHRELHESKFKDV